MQIPKKERKENQSALSLIKQGHMTQKPGDVTRDGGGDGDWTWMKLHRGVTECVCVCVVQKSTFNLQLMM